ncbi:disintegrin and metalloproteinase domain-containing protein 10-like [Schistocerca gregaria]|uniref:disintegrin and metalloproteinase domain-containing protein 10-like n=1 Tax=Schistocerca gregaria TaxID=7010 RepID=UPI00211DB358|nr:disintegrin and metalloproteinase domain-containing protein 10-like [Schistocerca gregaria]
MAADPLFVAESGGQEQAAVRIIKIASDADAVLRNADWDGDGLPDNVGISLRYLVTQVSGDRRLLRKASLLPLDSRHYLIAFAATEPLLARVCLGAAFTHFAFTGHVLGVSFTSPPGASRILVGVESFLSVDDAAGACQGSSMWRSPGVALNSLAVTSRSSTGAVPLRMQALALAHEIGHSLGAPHDGDAAFGTDACPAGRFLMSPLSVNGSLRDHYRFSDCSRRAVRRAARRHKWRCLEPATRPFCGNGLVEGAEECDCGMDVECREVDRCCVPRGRAAACRVNRRAGHACHPSLGPCCLCSCQFADLSHLGIDCLSATRLVDAKCPCASKHDCTCGVLGRCVGNSCHAVECAVLQLRECECTPHNGSCRTCCQLSAGDCLTAADAAVRLAQQGAFTLQVNFP